MKPHAAYLLVILSLDYGGPATANPLIQEEMRQADPDRGRWALSFENDVLAGGSRDKDYTYGLNLTYTGAEARDFVLSPYPIQSRLDDWWASGRQTTLSHPLENQSLEVGFYGFTPDDIEVRKAIPDDRPYASLVYLQSTRERVDYVRGTSWTSSLSVGILGLDIVGSGQNRVHRVTGSEAARGWSHQIADGGELTAKYSVAFQQFWLRDNPRVELKTSSQVSFGYITEASYGVSMRLGDIRSSWWSFDPELANYGERSSPIASGGRVAEHYLWGGLALKARAYNVFLQGQFRDSDVTLNSEQLNHLLLEAWLGYTIGFSNGYRISYWLRGHSSEIERGPGDRHLLWGGLIVSKLF